MRNLIIAAVVLAALAGCRKEDMIEKPVESPVEPPTETGQVMGFYLLNEGNMGSNKSTLDYFDATTGVYRRNIFADANPTVPKELGDVGNDLKIYGSRLYAVINCSNKVEVMDAASCRRIGQINIPNCRFIAFNGRYAYVTSYAGPVVITPDYKQIGYVAKVDTATMAVVDTVHVGFQPDQLAVAGGKIYVANSGGYMVPNYENHVSVIDIATFTRERDIEVAINLEHVVADSHGCIWISSRGDYYDVAPKLFCYDTVTDRIIAEIEVAVGSVWLDSDKLFIVGSGWRQASMSRTASYAVVDVVSRTKISDGFITDGTDKKIKIPYGVAVNPDTKEIYVTDARNYVNPGDIYCFSPSGELKWSAVTGDIPAHFAFRSQIGK